MIWIVQGVQNEIFQMAVTLSIAFLKSELCTQNALQRWYLRNLQTHFGINSLRARDAQLLRFEKVDFVFWSPCIVSDSRFVKGNFYFLD